ncbi:two component transcriptional regulator, LuxR family [Hydrocarboniphaga daqingensis]|uniref:Two component transcriptional regulator, LuxR family n=1 Tax=Hydrocarboniphaga daqingensis TaxID=490188 RepID=A0A1M5K4M4_9GAMM|nr:response regulator transcription factor [Hydrocarboniphaga daqingensis]SHG47213.1 two component transcriptional regulator, LuxR family [Hydrocarboniphaga daqingensis]
MNEPLVLLADDHPLFRAALRETLMRVLPGARVVESSGVAELQAAVQAHADADLLLLDLRMPGAQGFSTLIELRAQHPALPIAIVSAEEDPGVIRRALDFGASAFIPKSSSTEQIAEGLRAVLDGDTWVPPELLLGSSAADADAELAARVASLTPQQFRVLTLLADGRLNKQIGGDLDISEATIKAHVTAILRKLGLSRRTQAAVLAQRLLSADSGRLSPPEPVDEADAD